MGPYEVILIGFIAIFVTMVIVLFFPTCCYISRNEGFVNIQSTTLQCPKGTKTYTDLRGNTNCCKGEISGTKCEGTIQCTLSAPNDTTVPTCAALRRQYLQEQNKKCIFEEMPKYFETDTRKGCTKEVTETGDAPIPPNADVCILYGGELDKYYSDSCLKRKDAKQFFYITSRGRPDIAIDVYQDKVTFQPLHKRNSQQWRVTEQGAIVNRMTNKCLMIGDRIVGGGPIPSKVITLGECKGGESQLFFIDEKGWIRNKVNPDIYVASNNDAISKGNFASAELNTGYAQLIQSFEKQEATNKAIKDILELFRVKLVPI